MKLMIASDLHGSAFYCRQLLAAMEREQPDKLLLLGDILYHGPRNDLPEGYAPKEVIAMLKAGADRAATGENAVVVGCRRADVILGPIGIVMADALLGEITPAMAQAVAQSDARRILIPANRCDTLVVGVSAPIGTLVEQAAAAVLDGCRN